MKKLKVLHLASFEGNIGDNANHNGTRNLLRKNLDFDLSFENLEIRDFFWKKRYFNEEFVELVNKFDLLMIGGGNYFELWVDHSSTGTSIDISQEILGKINTPILFYALGVDSGQGASENAVHKFRNFIDFLMQNEKYYVTVRNDGAMECIGNLVGKKYLSYFKRIPDGGFFTNVDSWNHPEIGSEKTIIGINLAGDMYNTRFNKTNKNGCEITLDIFLRSFANVINYILLEDDDVQFILFPHIYKDLDIISKLMFKINDKYCRKKITVAPYLHGDNSQEYIFDLYRNCNLIIGNRFHANVCAIGLNIPTIGLVNYIQIENLYKDLNLQDRMICFEDMDFSEKMKSFIIESLRNETEIRNRYDIVCRKLLDDISREHSNINQWLKKVFNEK